MHRLVHPSLRARRAHRARPSRHAATGLAQQHLGVGHAGGPRRGRRAAAGERLRAPGTGSVVLRPAGRRAVLPGRRARPPRRAPVRRAAPGLPPSDRRHPRRARPRRPGPRHRARPHQLARPQHPGRLRESAGGHVPVPGVSPARRLPADLSAELSGLRGDPQRLGPDARRGAGVGRDPRGRRRLHLHAARAGRARHRQRRRRPFRGSRTRRHGRPRPAQPVHPAGRRCRRRRRGPARRPPSDRSPADRPRRRDRQQPRDGGRGRLHGHAGHPVHVRGRGDHHPQRGL